MTTMTPIRVGFMGPAGAGKTYFADYLVSLTNGVRASFADELKREMSEATGISLADFYTVPRKYELRAAMQAWGDEQRALDPQHYVSLFNATLKRLRERHVFVDDPRFTNELDLLAGWGFYVIRLDGPPSTNAVDETTAQHRSETEWQTTPYDLRLPWGDLAQRQEKLVEWLLWARPSMTLRPSPATS